MEVDTRTAAGITHIADEITPFYLFASFYCNFIHMPVKRGILFIMLYAHKISEGPIISCTHNLSICRSDNRCSPGGGNIQAIVKFTARSCKRILPPTKTP